MRGQRKKKNRAILILMVLLLKPTTSHSAAFAQLILMILVSNWKSCPDGVESMDVDAESANHSTQNRNSQKTTTSSIQSDGSESDNNEKPIPRENSIAHYYMHRKIMHVSLDMEHGGEYCGIVQLSCQLFRLHEEGMSKFIGEVEKETINEFVKTPKNAIWNQSGFFCFCVQNDYISKMPFLGR